MINGYTNSNVIRLLMEETKKYGIEYFVSIYENILIQPEDLKEIQVNNPGLYNEFIHLQNQAEIIISTKSSRK